MVNAELNGDVHFFRFPSEIPSLGKFGPKIQNWQMKLKSGTKINSNMQNWMVLFTFYVLNGKYSFWANFDPKKQNCQFKLKFGTPTNSNMQNSVVMFNFSDFDRK